MQGLLKALFIYFFLIINKNNKDVFFKPIENLQGTLVYRANFVLTLKTNESFENRNKIINLLFVRTFCSFEQKRLKTKSALPKRFIF